MVESTLADQFQSKVAGVCLIAGALLMIPNTFLEYADGRLFGAGIFGLLVYTFLIPGLLGIARLMRLPAPRLSVVAGLLATFGCVAGATFSTAMLHEWAAREAGTPATLMTEIMDITEGQVFPVLVTLGILFPISLLVLGVGLFRTSVVPTWVATLLSVGAIIFPIGHIGSLQLVTHLAESLLLIPMVWIGLRSLIGITPHSAGVPATSRN